MDKIIKILTKVVDIVLELIVFILLIFLLVELAPYITSLFIYIIERTKVI